jgi:hypothetical protein
MREAHCIASKAEGMAFTGVSFIRSVPFGGGYTFILLQSIAYPSAGSERTYIIDDVARKAGGQFCTLL